MPKKISKMLMIAIVALMITGCSKDGTADNKEKIFTCDIKPDHGSIKGNTEVAVQCETFIPDRSYITIGGKPLINYAFSRVSGNISRITGKTPPGSKDNGAIELRDNSGKYLAKFYHPFVYETADDILLKMRHSGSSLETKAYLEQISKEFPERVSEGARIVKQVERKIAADETKARVAKMRAKKKEGVSIGMSKQDVYESAWGRPKRVNSTHNAYGTHEQWVYDGGYLYFENDKLTSIQN